MTMRSGLGVFLGVLVGAAVASGVTGWLCVGTVTIERSYCTLCGMHREVLRTERPLGDRRRTRERAGAVYGVFHDAAGAHPHHWSRPSRTDNPRLTENLSEEIARGEVADLEALEAHPGMIAILEDALRADRGRSLAFMRRVLDPGAYVGAGTVAMLDRPGWPWEARFRLLEAFNAGYRCHADDLSVSCTAPVGAIVAVMFQETAGVGVAVSASDWRNWTPAGFAVPTMVVPSIPTAPQGFQQPAQQPAQAPGPGAPAAPSVVLTDAGGVNPVALSRSVSRSRTALSAGDLDGALAGYREARAMSPSDPSVRALRLEIRQQGGQMTSDRVLRGDCAGAQGMVRNLRASGIEPDESMFGSVCPAP